MAQHERSASVPNVSYLRGRRLEWYFCKLGRDLGWQTSRTAGSHGFFDVVWWRMKGVGSVMEGFEQIHSEGWLPEPDLSKVPDPWMYSYYRLTRGINKQWIWCLPIADHYSQAILFQMKTKLGKKRNTCKTNT
jgi:hypothetical protein